MLRRWRTPLLLWLLCAGVYVVVLGPRASGPTANNHYVHLAQSFLAGQLHLVGNEPPGRNDWACYDRDTRGACPPGRFRFTAADQDRYRWYVSFPPFPAVVIAPAVALWGEETPDGLLWALLAGLGPALVFVLLRALRERGRSARSDRENFVLALLFAFGTVFFFVAVQGTVWFAAHVVAVPLTALFLLWSLDARRPVLAGLMLGLAFLTRPTTLLLSPIFLFEALRVSRAAPAAQLLEHPDGRGFVAAMVNWVRGASFSPTIRRCLWFSLPILFVGIVAMAMNQARFDDPFEFGHTYLQIRWRPRIEKWGLFNFHYFAKNLSVFLAGLPWLSAKAPYVTISGHGLALWFTTPALLLVLWPKRVTPTMVGLYGSVAAVALLDLCYQNSGWVQFGYRFALDYMVILFALLALSGRRFGVGFYLAMVFAVAVNTFGALTFDRSPRFYDHDSTQNVLFQPD
ncbi:MAG: hypothetical protein KC416_08535 [Myxococcales bacterium]|nr:hypothetical protein [Myxococcales bacterium]